MTVVGDSSSEDSKVKVVVRVRPFNKRETDLSTKCVVQMESDQTFLFHPAEEKQPKTFAFDHCFESSDPLSSKFANQEEVFTKVGMSVIDNAFQGYNACIFAYGQTGSGKSYTMMGSSDNPGIIPRLCNAIFERIQAETSESTNFKVEVSYMEIYNERVRDLLDPKKSAKTNLKVREHKSLGPVVDGLCVLAVSSFDQISGLIDEGNKCRTVAATNMNTESSRSHAVFTIRLTHTLFDHEKGFSGEKVSKISLVDLAGSERAGKSGAMGKRLEEGGNINKSLTTLGMVISALAERCGKKEKFVPYRDSVLTWLLKDNLGGNSRTVMIATISPAADNYEETLSTLRYADRAKKIVNHAIINEDPNAKVIRELRDEVEVLKSQISQTKERETEYEELKERLLESERLMEQMNKSWEDRLKETDVIYEERQKDLAQIGISVAEAGIKVEKDRFYLVNLNADPSLNELLVYYINKKAIIGSGNDSENEVPSSETRTSASDEKVDFVLQGLGVHPRHAQLEIIEDFGLLPRLYIIPLFEGARICVNGSNISEKTLLKNGTRLLIGHNHFFRVNCPKDPKDENSLMLASTTMMEESQFFDYDKAWLEANSEEQGASISQAVDQYLEQINIKHQEEKQAALEKQYEEFERYIHGLTQTLQTPSTPMTPAGFGVAMTPIAGIAGTPSCGLPPVSFPTNPRNVDKTKFFKWAQKREEVFKESLKTLKTEIAKCNALVREANMIADEIMSNKRGQTHYDVTLQIPASNLRPSRIKIGTSVCEPVIVVRRNGMQGYQLWSVEQLENKLIDMREMYNDKINGNNSNDQMGQSTSSTVISDSPTGNSGSSGICEDEDNDDGEEEEDSEGSLIDTFFESQEKHSLIGVANVFLEVLFHDMKLDYHVPIISQHGEVCGKLHVEIYRIPMPLNPSDSVMSDSTDSIESGSSSSGGNGNLTHGFLGKTIRCRIRIKKASNLPKSLSHFVFCQYSFFNISEMLVVAPTFDPSSASAERIHPAHATNVKFDHEKDFNVLVTEEFLEYIQEDALSIEVWGHRSAGLGLETIEVSEELTEVALKQKGLQERWSEVTNRIEFWCDIKELNENGDYSSVEVADQSGVGTGGIYQLKQGQQRRITVRLRSLPERGNLPINIGEISTVSIGSICVKESDEDNEKQLDSYQEEDLDKIREQWTQALSKRQKYLEQQINALSEKGTLKTELDGEREQSLINQWISLTEERNAVSVPSPNSHIPGAPAEWHAPPGIEKHIPVVFLDINSEEYSAEDSGTSKIAGLNNVLQYEAYERMISLPILEMDTVESEATCSWDSSIHSLSALNRATNSGEKIYAIIRVVVRLSQPVAVDLVLRKRICINVYKKPSFTERLMKKIVGGESLFGTGVYYDLVGHIPKATLDMEDRETLALMAARHTSTNEDDFDEKRQRPSPSSSSKVQSNYIEAYTKSIQAVEWMLKLDRLRQESAMFNMLNKHERAARLSGIYGMPSNNFRMKRATSLPNTINNVTLPPIPPSSQHHRYSNHSSGFPPLPPSTSSNNNNNENLSSNKIMEMSASASSGYSSMARPTFLNLKSVNSLVSPMMEYGGRLSGIDEEQQIQLSEILTKEPVRSFTVPETLHSTNQHFSPKPVSPRLLSDLHQEEENNIQYSCSNHLFNENERHSNPRRQPSGTMNLEFDVSHA